MDGRRRTIRWRKGVAKKRHVYVHACLRAYGRSKEWETPSQRQINIITRLRRPRFVSRKQNTLLQRSLVSAKVRKLELYPRVRITICLFYTTERIIADVTDVHTHYILTAPLIQSLHLSAPNAYTIVSTRETSLILSFVRSLTLLRDFHRSV